MAHNPTFDTEPGYNPHSGGDRSGYSTPGQYGRQSPALDPGPYTNMASYRQATTGPPNTLSGDPATGNGKSYRYATAEPIPEDEEEKQSPVEARQVQFGGVGSASGYSSKSRDNIGGGGTNSKRILIIVIALAILFALLWVVFMGLYIREHTTKTAPSGSGAETGQVKQTGRTTDGAMSSRTIATGTLSSSSTQTAAVATTAAPDTIETVKMAVGFDGRDVYKYTLTTADKGFTAEVISLGARLYRLKTATKDVIRGFTTATDNATELAEDMQGIWHGPVCGETPTMHTMPFEREMTSDNSLRLKGKISDVDVVFTYTLHNNGKLMVTVTGTPVGNNVEAKMDICSSNDINLNPSLSGSITTHQLMINADAVFNPTAASGWGSINGIKDYTSLVNMATKLTQWQGVFPDDPISDTYRLVGPTGARQAAQVKTSASNIFIQTNQPYMGLYINTDAPNYIRLLAKGTPEISSGADPNRNTLKSGSTYEFLITYTVS